MIPAVGPADRLPAGALDLARHVRAAGGRVLVAGGWVRDRLLGVAPGDIDLEAFGLAPESLERTLARFGRVRRVGRSFGVWRVDGLDADISAAGPATSGVPSDDDLAALYREAARRRDLTVNAIAWDPLADRVFDPWNGRADLRARRLRATDERRFGEDPLRALRVARLLARHPFQVEPGLESLCAGVDLAGLAPERILEELTRLLVQTARPADGFRFLHRTGLLRFFPAVAALDGVPQDPAWHPEGDVLTHTLMVLDEAASLHGDLEADEARALMWAALTHDLGKARTTVADDGAVRSHGHESAGAELAGALLEGLRAPHRLGAAVTALVRHHLAPSRLVRDAASARAYRRLARRLAGARVSLRLLERLARADALGRTTAAARERRYPEGDAFLAAAREIDLERTFPVDVVLGRHLLSRGLAPGPEFGAILARCREIQDATGSADPDAILSRALGDGGRG